MARASYAFALRAGAHVERELVVTRFLGTEALSEPYLYEVDFFPLSREPLGLEELLGKEACLEVRRSDGAERSFHGIASAARFLGMKKGRPQYRVSISPRLTLLGCVTRSRTFLDLSVPAIVSTVLDAGKIAQRWELRERYPKRECTAQYRESDASLVMRLLEQEGIWFRFEQGDEGCTMVLADGREGYAEAASPVPYRQEDGAALDEEQLWELSRRTRTVPGKAVLRDYDFERPGLDLTVTAEEGQGAEWYEHPGGYTDPAQGRRLAKVRLEELRFGAETWSGRGRSLSLEPGRVFEVTDHPHGDWNGKLLPVRVAHEGRREEGAGSVDARYATSFFGIAASRPYRPRRRTARPEVHGFQRATVVGPQGEEIETDRHGRVRLAFHWNDKGEQPRSGWVRVLQAVAGPGFGALFLPRVGQEVLVSFQLGDPERPMVIGAVYHGAHPPPAQLPVEKTRSALRTSSSPHSGGFNELYFEDAAGAEEIYLRAERDKKIEVVADKDQRVGGSEALSVGKDRGQQIGGDQSLRVDQDDGAAVGGNRALTVVGERMVRVDGDQSEQVGMAQTVKVEGEQNVFVAKATNVAVGLGAALNVGAAYLVNVGIDHNTLVGGARLQKVLHIQEGKIAFGDVAAAEAGRSEDLTRLSHRTEKLFLDLEIIGKSSPQPVLTQASPPPRSLSGRRGSVWVDGAQGEREGAAAADAGRPDAAVAGQGRRGTGGPAAHRRRVPGSRVHEASRPGVCALGGGQAHLGEAPAHEARDEEPGRDRRGDPARLLRISECGRQRGGAARQGRRSRRGRVVQGRARCRAARSAACPVRGRAASSS